MGFRTFGIGFGVWGSGFVELGLRFGVYYFWNWVWSFRFRVSGIGFGAWGLEFLELGLVFGVQDFWNWV